MAPARKGGQSRRKYTALLSQRTCASPAPRCSSTLQAYGQAPPPPPAGYPGTTYQPQYNNNSGGTYNPNQQYYTNTQPGMQAYPGQQGAYPQQQTIYVQQQRPQQNADDLACCACLACLCALCCLAN